MTWLVLAIGLVGLGASADRRVDSGNLGAGPGAPTPILTGPWSPAI